MAIGAGILLFGVLTGQGALLDAGAQALAELAAQGYRIPTADEPVKVFPALTEGEFSARHAAGWRPGSIFLRAQPQGGLDAAVYLRHELLHEAAYRSCATPVPIWALEAAAMQFSGELAASPPEAQPDENQLRALKERIQQDAALESNHYRTLQMLVARYGWPPRPCAQSPQLTQILGAALNRNGGGFVLMSLPSGRILEAGGDRQGRLPPGSLLKIPYAAALTDVNPAALGRELAASDTAALLRRRAQLQIDLYHRFLTPISPPPSFKRQPQSEQDWRAYLGERGADGVYPLLASLPELALTLRAALQYKPDYFQGLSENGLMPETTLAGQSAADLQILRTIHALSKTGSASDANGRMLAGHLAVLWPLEHPIYLAVFRQSGVRGAALLPTAAAWLRKWLASYPPAYAVAWVRLLSLTPADSWEARPECPELVNEHSRYTLCGAYRIVSNAKGSRSERRVDGVLYKNAGAGIMLETDMQSYVEAVIDAEAQNLTGGALSALQAVIAWNAAHAGRRHPGGGLCDSTHCMVFMGQAPDKAEINREKIDARLLGKLEQLAAKQGLDWLPFAKGGKQSWQRRLSSGELAATLSEPGILEIRRERRKNGERLIHLYYPDSEEVLDCELFRNRLRLPSCPDAILPVAEPDGWRFEGIGAGHGLGLAVEQAQALSSQGRSAWEILLDAYQPR
ncbi:MAG: hypothetical protein ABSB19_04710 [Methylomonas sp.]|jgi:hypothetical protein